MITQPEFGRAIRPRFFLEEGMTFLNHGSFGATPREVLQAQQEWRIRLERQPIRFVAETLPGALRSAADRLANFVGAEGQDLVFVDNATTGTNSVLRSLEFRAGDQILCTDHCYGALLRTLEFVCERSGAELAIVKVPYPIKGTTEVLEAVSRGLTSKTRLAVLDHVTSATGLIFPIKELVAIAHANRVPVLVDGAHGPGMLNLDLPAIDADWYTGNCHKWMCAPKGCAFLWANPKRPESSETLHPPVISHFLGQGMTAEFDFVGTKDYSAYLAIDATLDFLEALGPERIRQHNRALALEGTRIVANSLGVDLTAPPEMLGSMASFPWTDQNLTDEEASPEGAFALRTQLWEEERVELSVTAFGGRFWIRLSAQIYNELSDYDYLAPILKARQGAR